VPFTYFVKDVFGRHRGDLTSLEGLEPIFGFLTPQHINVLTDRGIETRQQALHQRDPFSRWQG
jgi:hypothetical protein